MPRVPLIVLKAHLYYAGRRLHRGDRFLARGVSDATLLKALGIAQDAPRAEPTRPPEAAPATSPVSLDPVPVEPLPVAPVTEEAPKAEPARDEAPEPQVITGDENEPKRRRIYRRRDLVAEDE